MNSLKAKVQNTVHSSRFQVFLHFCVDYLNRASVHGLKKLGDTNIHWIEFLFWLLLVLILAISCGSVSKYLCDTYWTDSTVIAIDREYLTWNTTFPAITICPINFLDDTKVAQFVKSRASTVEDRKEITYFIQNISKINIMDFGDIPVKFYGIKPEEYLPIIFNLSKTTNPTVSRDSVFLKVVKTVSPLGICYTWNNEAVFHISSNLWGDTVQPPPKDSIVKINFYSPFPQMYLFKSDLAEFKAYVHATNDLPTSSDKIIHFNNSGQLMWSFRAFEITYGDDFIEKTSIEQRKCRTYDESNLEMFQIYTEQFCLFECNSKHSMENCRCIPHFYAKGSIKYPICGPTGLKCLASMNMHMFRNECNCVPNCRKEKFIKLQTNPKIRVEVTTTMSISVFMDEAALVRFKKEIIFTLIDLIIGIGGTTGLFLGCSVVSFIELIYFLTLRLFWYYKGYTTH